MTSEKENHNELILTGRIYEITKLKNTCKVRFISDSEYFTIETNDCSDFHLGDKVQIKATYTKGSIYIIENKKY